MSLLEKKFNGSLANGTHMMKFIGISEVEAKYNGFDQACAEYVVLEMETESGMSVKINCFEKQLGFVVRDLINAYAPGTCKSITELIELIGDKYIPVTKYTTQGKDKTFTNYSFRPQSDDSDEDEGDLEFK